MSKHRASLSYGEYRKVEELIRAVWTPMGYETGGSDESIALAASKVLQRVVTTGNVKFVRDAMGLTITSMKLVSTLLTQAELTRLEEHLREHGRVVIVKDKSRATIYTYEVYTKISNGVKERKPWLKAARVNHQGVVAAIS